MTNTKNRSGSAPRGFTLIEVMITLSVVSFGLLAMLSMQMNALRDGTRSRHRTGASMIARDQIEQIEYTAFSDAALDVMSPIVWATPAWLANGSDPDLGPGEIPVTVTQAGGTGQEIVYTVWYLVTADDPVTPDDDLRRVDVEVVWNEIGISNNRPTRTGQPTVAVSTMLVDNDR